MTIFFGGGRGVHFWSNSHNVIDELAPHHQQENCSVAQPALLKEAGLEGRNRKAEYSFFSAFWIWPNVPARIKSAESNYFLRVFISVIYIF